MAQSKQEMKLPERIASDLRQRNEREKRFEGVVRLCGSLHETVDFLEKENLRLRAQNCKLEEENLARKSEADSKSDSASSSLHKKIYELQKELTELHKNKGEHAEEVIELRRAVDEKEKELKQKTQELERAEAALRKSKHKKEYFEEKAAEAENSLQLVKDEYAALMLTYSSLKKAKEDLEKEHSELVARWMAYKAKEADDMNMENELIQKMKQTKLRKAMEEAIQEPVRVLPGPSKLTSNHHSGS